MGDGKTLTTEAIQKTIDAASKAGGGKVIFEKGIYVSGSIFVKSNVELNIGEGVVIKAIQDDSQYPERMTRIAGFEMDWPSALINVYEEKNVRITGKGIIDGNGKFWWDKFWGDPPRSGGMWVDYKEKDVRWAVDYDCKRVRAVVVYKSENVLLKNFTVKRSGFWTISLTYSNKVHVDGITVRNNIDGFGPSSDGINTDSSKDILVENCDIDCNDDNLCIKAGRDADGLRVNRQSENIVYRNCITRAGHGLITLGSETSGGMKNIEVYGLEAIGTNIGVRIKSAKVRGGVIQNIWFHDIKMKDVANPFHFELNWYPEYSYPTIPDNIPEEEISDRWRLLTQRVIPPEKGIPEFKDINLSNITVENANQAIYANAYEEKPMSNISWENISIDADNGGIINHASNWSMKNVSLKLKSDNTIRLNNCVNIEQPQITFSNESKSKQTSGLLTLDDQIQQIKEKYDGISIIPVNTANNIGYY
ncbi:MAG: glycoside hydrolase family 28 protein [Ignavibacteriales bacterium]|nr:glycoside hydrolase family 28 protein [Ignavibacteriales bacterium]